MSQKKHPKDEPATLRLTFDGPATENGTMPVKDLAEALLALDKLFTEVQRTIDPTAPPVYLEVKSFGPDPEQEVGG